MATDGPDEPFPTSLHLLREQQSFLGIKGTGEEGVEIHMSPV